MLKTLSEINTIEEDYFFDEIVIYIDHRSEDDSLFIEILDDIGVEFTTSFDDIENCTIDYNGQTYNIPFTITRHDRYVAISSAAYLVKDGYDFWLMKDHLEDDTHGLVILDKKSSAELKSVDGMIFEEKFVPLELGYDYFNNIKVPYINNESNNPDFQEEALRIEESLIAFRKEISKAFSNSKKPLLAKIIDFIKSYWFPLLLLALSIRYFFGG